MKTEDEYQKLIDLTLEQEKAFKSLRRAIKKCEKANIYFYQCLEHLGALNGDNVKCVEADSDSEHMYKTSDSPDCLQFKYYPTVTTACSFADDNHFIRLIDES